MWHELDEKAAVPREDLLRYNKNLHLDMALLPMRIFPIKERRRTTSLTQGVAFWSAILHMRTNQQEHHTKNKLTSKLKFFPIFKEESRQN